MAREYAALESRLVRTILQSEQTLLELKFELFSVKDWIRKTSPAAKANVEHQDLKLTDLPQEDLKEIFRHCELITRARMRRVNKSWRALLNQRSFRETQFMDIDCIYGSGRHMHFMKMVDFTEKRSDTTLTHVKAYVSPIRQLVYNALGRGIRFRHQQIFKLDQCELLRKFLNNCPKLESLVMRNLPGLTWTHLTAGLTVDCPELAVIYSINCDQTVDILKTDFTYAPARKRMPVPFMEVSMRGDVAKNFDVASDALLWPFPAAEKKAQIAWIAKYTPQLTGMAHAWAKLFLKKRIGFPGPPDTVDLRKVDYNLVQRDYWLMDLTSLIMDNPVPGMTRCNPKWLYR